MAKVKYLEDYQYAGESKPRDLGIYKSFVTSPAWYSLKSSSRDVYIQLIAKKNIGESFVFLCGNELKQCNIDPKTYIRAVDDLINHGFLRVVGYTYLNKFKPTVCVSVNCTAWRKWTKESKLEEFIKLYIPREHTRHGNSNYGIKTK